MPYWWAEGQVRPCALLMRKIRGLVEVNVLARS